MRSLSSTSCFSFGYESGFLVLAKFFSQRKLSRIWRYHLVYCFSFISRWWHSRCSSNKYASLHLLQKYFWLQPQNCFILVPLIPELFLIFPWTSICEVLQFGILFLDRPDIHIDQCLSYVGWKDHFKERPTGSQMIWCKKKIQESEKGRKMIFASFSLLVYFIWSDHMVWPLLYRPHQ